jgi:chemotaxis protein MotA
MDKLSIFALALAAGAVLGGQWLEGGSLGSLLQPAASLIVLGGTLAAVMLQCPLATFVRNGLQMLVDGFEPERIREALDIEIAAWDERHRAAAKVWEAAGGYAPTIGILGAVLGLIHVMENLSDPARLGGGIAVAFVATVYGVGSANLLFLPIAHKLRTLIEREVTRRELLQDGLLGIANGENPRLIEARLSGYLA